MMEDSTSFRHVSTWTRQYSGSPITKDDDFPQLLVRVFFSSNRIFNRVF